MSESPVSICDGILPEKLVSDLRDGKSPVFPVDSERYQVIRSLLGEAICDRLGVFPIPDGFCLSVVIPVFNEVDTITNILNRLDEIGLPMELILVDDGSTDGTRQRLEELAETRKLRVILHDKNQGKGAAIRTGMAQATGDVIVIQDADLEYDPVDFWWLLQPILSNRADVVYGSRYLEPTQAIPPLWHRAVNGLLSGLASLVAGKRFTDVETCYKMMRRSTVEPILPELKEDRFGIEIELTFRLVRQTRARFFEVPIRYERRTYAEGKKITWRDGVAALWCIARYGVLPATRD